MLLGDDDEGQSMDDDRLWIFGYGSLLWEPGFAHDAAVAARLDGYARSFCMRSIHHRGSVEAPGLVLALDADPGASCEGLAFRAAPGTEAETLAYLRERELISSAYLERELPVSLQGGETVRAVVYVIDPEHAQYCGNLPLTEQAEIIARAHGGRGANAEYLFNTVRHIREMGLEDPDLVWLETAVRKILRG